ncbi:hypothetical protein BKA61DRAFT_3427 [Leptodontidium sp. MPI-SDFR-AT-0119]|nr:hypothetical protein BKA61DRAFT_3427 [Leptodontidium sp. MPI-SDFR-AT-0119]
MLTSMKPSRPKLPHHQPPPPTNQQQTRTSSSLSSPRPNTKYTPIPPPPPPFPRSQIEAMPPTPFPVSRNPMLAPQQMVLDVSKRHPVFFTERLKKAPVGVQTGSGSWSNPVATGYVFNDGVKRRAEGKL